MAVAAGPYRDLQIVLAGEGDGADRILLVTAPHHGDRVPLGFRVPIENAFRRIVGLVPGQDEAAFQAAAKLLEGIVVGFQT